MHDRLHSKGMCSESCDIFKFWELSDNISLTLTAQHRNIVAMESYVAYQMAPLVHCQCS